MVALIDKAVTDVQSRTGPIALVFAAVDETNTIRNDGPALSLMALHAASSVRQKPLAASPLQLIGILAEANCWRPGTVVDQETIDLSCQASEATVYALPIIRESPTAVGQAELTIMLRNVRDSAPPKTVRHSISMEQLTEVPGILAQALLEYLGVTMSDEEKDTLRAPEVSSGADLIVFSDLLNTSQGVPEQQMLALVSQSPGCVSAWEFYLQRSDRPHEVLSRMDQVQPPLLNPFLEVTIARGLCAMNRPEDGLIRLLKPTTEPVRDSYFWDTLARCALRLDEERVMQPILSSWRTCEPGYVGSVGRGKLFLDWAGNRDTSQSTESAPNPRGQARYYADARVELEKAIQLNERDWQARILLIRFANVLDVSPDSVAIHAGEASKLRLRSHALFAARLEYDRSRLTIAPEEFSATAKACLDSGLWEDRVPQLVFTAVQAELLDSSNAAMHYGALQKGAMWDSLAAYHQAVQSGTASSDEKQRASKTFAKWAAFSGHYREAAQTFWNVPIEFAEGRRGDEVYGSLGDYCFLTDLLDAQEGFGARQHVADAAIALARGDWKRAESRLARWRVEPQIPWFGDCVQLTRNRVELFKRLASERTLVFGLEETQRGFATPTSGTPDSPIAGRLGEGWSGDDRRITWQYSGVSVYNTTEIYLPLNLSRATIDGEIEWSPEIKSVELIAHAYSPRDTVMLVYEPQRGAVNLVRNGTILRQSPIPDSTLKFKLEYGATVDRLQPFPGEGWEAVVKDDVPSGFGLRVETSPGVTGSYFVLSNLRIRLPDDQPATGPSAGARAN